MKTRLLYLTVAGSLAMPSIAADAPKPEWGLYGTVITEIYNAKTTGATTTKADGTSITTPDLNLKPRNMFTTATSNVGFKGSMPVPMTSDTKVWLQIETAIAQDGDAPPSGANGIGTRNTALGFAGSWGNIFGGQWDTPYKAVQMGYGVIPGSLESDVTVLGTPGRNVSGTKTGGSPAGDGSDATFNRRQGNSVQYWSPEVQGFQLKVMYSVDEYRTSTPQAASAAATTQVNPTMWDFSLQYKNPGLGLTVQYAYEQHANYFGMNRLMGLTVGTTASNVYSNGANGSTARDTGNELCVRWEHPTTGARVYAAAEWLKYSTNFVNVTYAPGTALTGGDAAVGSAFAAKGFGLTNYTGTVEAKRTSWWVQVDQNINEHNVVWVGIGAAGNLKTSATNVGDQTLSDTGTTQWVLGYSYVFSKNTGVYGFVNGMNNQTYAQYTLQPKPTSTVSCGADIKEFGIGAFYKF